MKHKRNADTQVKKPPRYADALDDDLPSQHAGFHSSEDLNFENGGESKYGSSEAMRKNVFASSADISTAPDSAADGEDNSEADSEVDLESHNNTAVRRKKFFADTNSSEPADEEVYATDSDELEMARAHLVAATQSPGNRRDHDPSSASVHIEETDDFEDFDLIK